MERNSQCSQDVSRNRYLKLQLPIDLIFTEGSLSMKSIYIYFITILIPSLLNAQGQYLEKGISGIDISGEYALNNDLNSFTIGLGYSFNGIFDIGFDYSNASLDNDDKLYINFYGPCLRFHVLKQSKVVPISFSFSASYLFGSYSGDYLKHNNLELSCTTFGTSGIVYGTISKGSLIEVMPEIGISYYKSNTKLEILNGESIDDDSWTTTLKIGVSLICKINTQNSIIIIPGISIDENNTTALIGLNFIFSSS